MLNARTQFKQSNDIVHMECNILNNVIKMYFHYIIANDT